MVSTVKIFDITIPQKSDLCCAICKIVNFEKNLIYSKFCAKMLKCREFLQETPLAMAAPITNRKILVSGGSIYIIVTKELFESCAFQNHCDTLNIQTINLLEPIPTNVYKACLLYTMEYKVAPQWNKVGLYLVEGQDFLSSNGNVDAVMLDIKEIRESFMRYIENDLDLTRDIIAQKYFADNSAQLLMKSVNLRIPFVRLNRTHSLQYDLQSPVRVLPSMKMANVLRVSKTIKSLFKDYEDLRAYWKNMHGYMLPDYEDGFLFYNIEFFYFKSNIFLYPEMCLTSGPLEILPSATDPLSRIYKFIGDLRRKVTKLCEQQLDICLKNTFQTAVLTCTPVLSKVRLPAYDTGYGTQSRRISSVTPLLRIPDTCDIPTKRSRLSLSRTDDSLTCATEIDDFDLDIKPCFTNKLNLIKAAGSISAILCDVDNATVSKPIVQKDESKSCYFKTEEQKSESKPFVELTDKEERLKKLSLKEKLSKNF